MRRIEFYDREKETKEIMDILNAEPSLITFVYGPINSGKTTMISHLVKELPDDYAPFYVNLRGRFITDYEDFLNILFEIDERGGVDNVSEYAKSIIKDLGAVSGIPIPINLFERIFEKKDKSKDMFKYIEQFFTEISKNRIPVLIIDELQVIGDIKINELLMYKLFNFFIRLTKELHLCHIFAVSSDSLFIEQVYSEAMLSGRCRYLLVDDFDKDTTMGFLENYEFSEKEKELAWNYCGGKPVYLVELTRVEDVEKMVAKMLKVRMSQISELLNSLLAYGEEIEFRGELHEVVYDNLVEELSKLKENVNHAYGHITPEISYLVRNNIIFVDPSENMMRAQSRLDLLAVREVIADT
ncbi:MAG: AAA family ATPase [ANME-2 cluster archaeon]|nr:AAA family ATPase [ANME-2 cluster archaeon]MBC2701510.1 AAA family ATPase [ANME-2 cluster archaeon]MBC2706845.1 AAA family ATPase [ANME-2 cluster archaeon]MBC2746134.1 AAA family ATPase [ANME-2 cluster archaeon]MBC2762180.1 AAA family ATPase [ANME-2 cluster archaeon]